MDSKRLILIVISLNCSIPSDLKVTLWDNLWDILPEPMSLIFAVNLDGWDGMGYFRNMQLKKKLLNGNLTSM